MNYIKKLQEENERLQKQQESLENGLRDLKIYLDSDKFRAEGHLQGYVSIRDVMLRLNEGLRLRRQGMTYKKIDIKLANQMMGES